MVRYESLRGEPGYEEEGIYVDGKKEGVWRKYSIMGDLLAVENYRWGNKDGKSQYFSLAGITREENWKAVNPDNPYDTVDVYDPYDPTKIARQIVKIEGTSVKHGTWKYYDSETGRIARTQRYFLDKLQEPPVDASGQAAEGNTAAGSKANARAKPKEVLEFEKKTGRKKVKVIDGSTNN